MGEGRGRKKAPPFAFVIILLMFIRMVRGLEIFILLAAIALLVNFSNPSLTNPIEKVRAYTRSIEFNYLAWMADAAILKIQASSLGLPYNLNRESQKQIVTEYMRTTQDILQKEYQLELLYADPAVLDKETASEELRSSLEADQTRRAELAPLAESVLQDQISRVLADQGFTAAGQPLPGVWYHSTALPMALIVSPRGRIEQTANISINMDLSVDEQSALEDRVDNGLDSSSLVVHIGGVGVYPTMVMRSTDMPYLLSTIAHEWIHNYLTFRPLGILYGETPELRTMNETTASIAGNEIGQLTLERFYPELVTYSNEQTGLISIPFENPGPADFLRPPFDFRAQMHETRLHVDELLAEGKIEEAEAYMEERRQVFLQNGYLLRKINQAYFAFFGAYADSPGGAAGQDPVGPAVRALREQSNSLADFVNTISWMTSFETLQEKVGNK